MPIPRLRMFAGPNGSGKTTIKRHLDDSLIGVYINPDEIEIEIRETQRLTLCEYNITCDESDRIKYFENSPLLNKSGLQTYINRICFSQDFISFVDLPIDLISSYLAAMCAEMIRDKLIQRQISFTFETVMSSADKIEILKKAQAAGFKTYLYFVSTKDPIINIDRVRQRYQDGGHNVPEDKIRSRYYRSLDNLLEAVKYSNRAYIFDNSGKEDEWVAEITDASEVEIKVALNALPEWFIINFIDKALGTTAS